MRIYGMAVVEMFQAPFVLACNPYEYLGKKVGPLEAGGSSAGLTNPRILVAVFVAVDTRAWLDILVGWTYLLAGCICSISLSRYMLA